MIPVALHRIVVQLGIHREIEQAVGAGLTMLAGLGLTALAILVTMPVTADADVLCARGHRLRAGRAASRAS